MDDETSVKVEGDQIVKLKHKPVIHGNKTVSEYLKSKRLKYKFDQAVARDPRFMALRAQDAKSAAQRAKREADKKQNNDKTLQKIREETRAAIAERAESVRMQSMEICNETPAQQVEEATRLALIQAQKAQEDARKREQEVIKQEKNIIYKLQMERIQAERTRNCYKHGNGQRLNQNEKKKSQKMEFHMHSKCAQCTRIHIGMRGIEQMRTH